jgi:hypothetical protein
MAARNRSTAEIAKALNVNERWLRTGKGSSLRPLADNDEDEALAIVQRMTAKDRAAWLTIGRALVATTGGER